MVQQACRRGAWTSAACGTGLPAVPKVHMYLDQIMTSYNIACMEMGAAFVTDKIITYGYPRTEVVFYKLGGPVSKRKIVFAHKKNINGYEVSLDTPEYINET